MKKFGPNPEKYTVGCLECGQYWQPAVGSRLWWKAHKLAETGRLDALHITGEECGCCKKTVNPNAPFRVFGFSDMGEEFDVPYNSIVKAAQAFIASSRAGCVVFISGLSITAERKLEALA